MRLTRIMSIILFLSSVYASKIEFDRYTIDDGLSQNTVYEVFQDSRGYIWLGTQGGLDRFNGYEFKHYEHESNDSTSIVNGWICLLYTSPSPRDQRGSRMPSSA